VIESGTTSSMLLRCGNCAAIVDLNVSLSSDTPGAHLRGVVVASRPCECGTTARAMVHFGGEDA